MKKILLLLMLFVAFDATKIVAQQTYYWAGGNTGTKTWNTAANWNTTLGGGGSVRTTPNVGDILIFDGNNLGSGATGALVVSTLVNETEAQIKFINSATVTLGHSSTRTITIAGGIGDDFVIEAGSSVTIGFTSFASAVTLFFNSGTTGYIAGTLTLQLGSHKITPAAAANCITFAGTSVLNYNVTSGNVFGSTAVSTNNNVVFQSGSYLYFGGGSNPFGASSPASVVEFQPGSNYVHNGGTPSTSGRYYANFIVNASLTLGSNFGRVQNFIVNSGFAVTINHTSRIPITGNIQVLGTGSLATGPNIPGIILCGTGAQSIDFGTSVTQPTFDNLIIGSDAIVTLVTDITINPASTSTSSNYGILNLGTKRIIGAAGATFRSLNSSTGSNPTCGTTIGTNVLTIADGNGGGSGFGTGYKVTGPGIPADTYIAAGSGGTPVSPGPLVAGSYNLSNRCTATATNITVNATNNGGNITTSNTGGLATAITGFGTTTLNGNITLNAVTTTPFPASGTVTVSPTNLTTNANVTLNKDLSVTGVLTVGSGTLDLGANNITLVSTSTNTARVANCGASAFSYSGAGKFNLQRYIPGNRRAFRFLGNPFSNDIAISQLTNTNGANTGIDITGVSIGAIFGSGTAALTGDVVTSIAVDFGGFGYLTAPTVTLTGDGTGATATAIVSSGSITGFTVTNGGSGYTAPPTVILNGGFGFTPTATNNASVFSYDPVIGDAGTNPDPGWSAFNNATATNWFSKQGIRVLVRGTKGEGLTGGAYTPSATTITMTGTLNDGTSPVYNLTNGTNSNFNLIANPLASTIDMQALSFGGANVGLNYYVWDPNLSTSGQYITRPFTAGTAYRYLPMGSAFFATTTSTGTITFPEIAKATATAASVLRGTSAFGANSMQLELTDNTGLKHDEIIVFLDNTASNNFDNRDALKMTNTTVNFYSNSTNAKKLSIDARPFTLNSVIPITLATTIDNDFTITATNFNVDDIRDILLHDKKTNTYTTLNLGVTYSFTSTLADATSYGDRFELVMRASNALPTTFLNVKAAQKNTGIEVSFTTANETNMSNYQVEESIDGNNFSKATIVAANNATTNVYNWFDGTVINGDNYYRIKAIEKNGTVKYSIVVKVKIGGKGAAFTVYPNPIKGGVVSLQMSNVEKGIYTVKIYNNIGQELAAKTINHNGGSATQSIDLGKGIASGAYNMQITNGTTVITKTVIIE
jgi:hypothetical protein